MEMDKLKKIEEELSGCVKLDKRNWTRIYQLMREVESEKLYTHRSDTPTFTSWVNALSSDLSVHVSLLWSRLKAGKIYDEYFRRAEQQGQKKMSLEDVSVSPDSINLCAKVAGKNAAEMDHLIDRVLEGQLTREDLRAAAKARRASENKDGTMPAVLTRHNRIEEKDRTETEIKVTAADIVLALRRPDWLVTERTDYHFEHVYRCFPEFRMDTGTSRHARRVDALVIETVTALERDQVIIRGIEIKVDKHDLENDHKMAEYTEFCDYFSLAIPDDNEMIDLARSIIRPEWGILTISKEGSICEIKKPEKLEAILRDKILATCIIKLMSSRN